MVRQDTGIFFWGGDKSLDKRVAFQKSVVHGVKVTKWGTQNLDGKLPYCKSHQFMVPDILQDF